MKTTTESIIKNIRLSPPPEDFQKSEQEEQEQLIIVINNCIQYMVAHDTRGGGWKLAGHGHAGQQ
jgi:hypothetical protein